MKRIWIAIILLLISVSTYAAENGQLVQQKLSSSKAGASTIITRDQCNRSRCCCDLACQNIVGSTTIVPHDKQDKKMDSATLFRHINELIAASAKLLWPIVTFILVFLFRRDISGILERLRKGKLFGQEVELDPAVNEFRKSVEEAQVEIPTQPIQNEVCEPKSEDNADKDTSEVLEAAKINPELGVIKLSSILEKEIRILAGCLGALPAVRTVPATQVFRSLIEKGYLPKHTNESLKMFWELRNEIVHGHTPKDNRNILMVLDVGLVLLNTIRAIPHEVNLVHNPGVDLFLDEGCTVKLEESKGLILETTSPGKATITFRIFPTRKSSYYVVGKQVTWEWNLSVVWGKCWYIDPETQEKRIAWDSAGEFVGRHVDEL